MHVSLAILNAVGESAPASCGTHRGREMAARDVPGSMRHHLLTTPHICKSSTVRGRNCARVPGAHWLRCSHHCKTLQWEPVEFTQSHRLLRSVDWSLKRRLNVPPTFFLHQNQNTNSTKKIYVSRPRQGKTRSANRTSLGTCTNKAPDAHSISKHHTC